MASHRSSKRSARNGWARLRPPLLVAAVVVATGVGAGLWSNYGSSDSDHTTVPLAQPGGIPPIPLPIDGLPELGSLGSEAEPGESAAEQSAPGQPKDLGDGTFLAPYTVDDGVKVFDLRMSVVQWEIKPGIVKEAFAFNGIVPGPTIRVTEGDRVRLVVKNDLPPGEHTAVHWHGMDLPNDQDGVPGLTQEPIMPGETYTYEWTAVSPGTHWYHTHMDGNQVGKGLYGSLEVVPKRGEFKVDRDYRFIVNDGINGFIANGKSFPATTPFKAKVGERVRIRIIGSGPEMAHFIHLHGGFFTVVAQDGRKLKTPYEADTLNVGVGQTFDIIFVPPKPGKWLLHCHIFSHSETKAGMQGMVTYLDVSP